MLKQAGKVLGIEALGALWLKQHSASEEAMANDLKGYFRSLEQDVYDAVSKRIQQKLDDLADDENLTDDEIGQEAEDIADDLLDVDEIENEVKDVIREQIYNQVATGAATEWNLSLPQKYLNLAWIKSPIFTWKEVCHEPAGSPTGGQFVSCGEGGSGATDRPDKPESRARALRGDFSKLPARSDVVGVAVGAASPLLGVSISAEADRAVDAIVNKRFDEIRQRYGDELGTAIIGAGFLGGLTGVAATVAGGAALAAGGLSAGVYTGAASALAVSLLASPVVGGYTARYAVAPLIGAARYISSVFPKGGKSPTTPTTDEQFREIAQREWHDLLDEWEKAGIKSVKAEVDAGGITAGLRIDLPPVMRAAVERYAEGILARPYWRGIAETIRDDIASDIRRGVLDGLSGKEIKDSLKESVNSDARAENIARTETTGALNSGSQATREELAAQGLIDGKQWLCILDNSVRPTHEEANEQTVPVDEPFKVGDEEAMFPGDPDLSPEERCRCRCTAVSTFSDEELPQSADAADAEKRARWRKAVVKWWPKMTLESLKRWDEVLAQ